MSAENTTLVESQEYDSEWHVWGMARQLVCWGIRNVRELVEQGVTEVPWGQIGEGGGLPGKGICVLSVRGEHC